MTVVVRLSRAQLDQLLRSPQGPVVHHVDVLTRKVLNKAKRLARVDSGNLRDTLYKKVTPSSSEVRGRVASPLQYAIYLHEGTGIYGPKKRPIVPVRARALRFTVKKPRGGRRGGGNVVFAASVKGVKPDKFLVRALKAEVPYPITESK
ncbi:hypothetical protein [Microtetraspora malaysiensis]|uniref:Minor tail protein n=1 Tax=Microtetraspora malaysiensis TaxID=161358 RepID=A0ABW6SKI1_9ACTN